MTTGTLTEMRLDPVYKDCPDKQSYQSGLEFQDFVCTELSKKGIILQNLSSRRYQYEVGENLQGFEIKLDRPFLETGRLSIEIQEKSHASIPVWTNSGIYRDDNSWLYIQGNYKRFYIFAKSLLILMHKSKIYLEDTSHGTIKKFYLPLNDADKYCAKRIDILSTGSNN